MSTDNERMVKWWSDSEKDSNECFHKGSYDHDTYREQGRYVESLGNQWASENFNATKPYFA